MLGRRGTRPRGHPLAPSRPAVCRTSDERGLCVCVCWGAGVLGPVPHFHPGTWGGAGAAAMTSPPPSPRGGGEVAEVPPLQRNPTPGGLDGDNLAGSHLLSSPSSQKMKNENKQMESWKLSVSVPSDRLFAVFRLSQPLCNRHGRVCHGSRPCPVMTRWAHWNMD